MAEAIRKYPNTNSVFVRRHGIYVWEKTWQSAKSMAECYHYSFEVHFK
ncbi:putative Methylthioribulose-1-phosphate dehydratase-like protein [Leptotrombidium deliense]|uniref:Putative Methylthioribulose-1-phosphate dehydratase-like protein n=1 Tax=Leptotrombidium deliense TaxID=299467 RepID=A0A443SHK2_9ACAR|nr:putative Methylthioribulose-1-phosphate dehydratase-like protein [Leptotrombidium deliense]